MDGDYLKGLAFIHAHSRLIVDSVWFSGQGNFCCKDTGQYSRRRKFRVCRALELGMNGCICRYYRLCRQWRSFQYCLPVNKSFPVGDGIKSKNCANITLSLFFKDLEG